METLLKSLLNIPEYRLLTKAVEDGKTAALPLTIGNTTTALTQGRMQYTTTRGHSIQDGVMSIITSGPSLQNSRLTSMSGVTKKYDAMGWSTGSETYPLYYYSIKLPE